VDWGLSITNDYLAEDIVREPIVVANGKVRLPVGPGLGIEIDEAKLSRLELHLTADTPPHNAQAVSGTKETSTRALA
jgi:hypothetical protein